MEAPPGPTPQPSSADPDGERYARHWEPVLLAAGRRLLARIDAAPGVVLDVGCGTGALASHAADRWSGSRIVGLDASAAMLSVAQRTAAGRSLAADGRVTWTLGDAQQLPLDDACVDVATAAFVLGLVEQRTAVLREVLRVLAPGGIFGMVGWLDTDVVLPADDAFEAVLDELAPAGEGEGPETTGSSDPASVAEMHAALAAAGFVAIDACGDQLRHAWTPEGYLAFKLDFDDRERIESLDAATRRALVDTVRQRWDRMDASAFELRAPLVSVVAQRPG